MFTIDTRLNDGNEDSSGFWIKGTTVYPIKSSHIRAILDNPELFGFTKEELIERFRKHHEKIGFEGKARKEIIIEATRSGWIRGRYYKKGEEYLSLTLSRDPTAGNCPNGDPEEKTDEERNEIDYLHRWLCGYLRISVDVPVKIVWV